MLDHGTRACYQRTPCRCLPCRAAEAVYRRKLRGQHAHGIPPLGAMISAHDAWRKIRQLKAERLSKAEIARRLGLKAPRLRWHPDRIRMKNALKLHRLVRALLAEGPDRPLNTLNITDDATRG